MQESWDKVISLLRQARQLCGAEVVQSDEGFSPEHFEEYLYHNELELALDEVESISYDNKVPREFWETLLEAAQMMKLDNHVRHYLHILDLYDSRW